MSKISDEKYDELLKKLDDGKIGIKELLIELSIEDFKEEKENDQNKPFMIAYKNIVEKTSAFLNSELLVEDPITASIIFEYLLWNGYFSDNNYYEFRMDQRINKFSSFGADIMRGKGVCLNNATMLSDVLNCMDYNSCTSVCYVHQNGELPKDIGGKCPIERHIYQGNTFLEKIGNKKDMLIFHLLKPITVKVGNHAIVLSEYNGETYAIDPTNLCFMTHKEENVLNSLNGYFDFDLKKTITNVLNCESVDKSKNLLEKINNVNNSYVSFLDNDTINECYEEQVAYCDSKKKILDDFHKECLNDIDTVCKTLSKKKNR